MKALIVIALALISGAALIWMADFQPGFVLLQYGNWSLETSLVVFIIAFVLLVIACYSGLRSLMLLRQTPRRIKLWRQQQRQRRASQELTKGLITLEEGRWAEAERLLLRHARNSETPLLHYLAAARAAQKQLAPERRDNYLKLAHETTAGADIAVGVVQAELQLSAGQKEQALATLQHLREMSPKHPYVLQLLQQLYQEMDQWQDVQAVLPDLRKRNVLSSSVAATLSTDATVGQLDQALLKQDWTKMALIWQKAPSKARQTEAMLKPYIRGLIIQGESDQALLLIEEFLRKNWSDALIYQYGQLKGGDLLKRVSAAEKWLKSQADNPWLLLSLGLLAKHARLWAKAEYYLKESLTYGARGETFEALAEVYNATGDDKQAADAYRNGLRLMLEQNDNIPS